MPLENGDLTSRRGVPHARCLVVGRGYDPPSVRAERGALHDFPMSLEDSDLHPRRGVPHARCLVKGRGHDLRPVRAECGAIHPFLVPLKDGDLAAPGGVPNARRLVLGCGHDPLAFRAEPGAQHRVLMASENGDLPPRRGVPHARRFVLGCGHDPLSVRAKCAGDMASERPIYAIYAAIYVIYAGRAVPLEDSDLQPRRGVPHARCLVKGRGHDLRSVWTERGAVDRAPKPIIYAGWAVPLEDGDLPTRRGVPHARRPIFGRGHDLRRVQG